ncbi:hypothetical protein BS47DRAFT_1358667 [Hydnum rufescens UP504]|uniref:C3H1-type domain-containing protein n=1 Tax=Hydnum rufescens UP504 TaxID=1448309 RepID=A0A9P6DXT6_9AGAM|nr:hypothetical protein BS47DRAFT_1358667 [Hydnum rufescens UP504]
MESNEAPKQRGPIGQGPSGNMQNHAKQNKTKPNKTTPNPHAKPNKTTPRPTKQHQGKTREVAMRTTHPLRWVCGTINTDEAQGNIQEHAATQTPPPSIHPLKVPPSTIHKIYGTCHTLASADTSTSQYLTQQTNRQARGETQQHTQPPKPPSSICNIDADETNMVPHARFSGYLHPTISHLTNEQTARAKHGSMRSHPRSPPSTICNIHADNQIQCHTPTSIPPPHDTHPTNEQTARAKHSSTRSHQGPPPQPSATYTPTTKYGATHPLKRVCGTLRYLHLVIPHPTNEQTGPGRNMAARAATPCRFDYPQHMCRRSKCSATHPLRWIAPPHDTPPAA